MKDRPVERKQNSPAPLTHLFHESIRPCDVMPREKRWELWTAVSGLLALISRAYHNFSLWHHEFIKAKLSAALVVLN